jgi:hypothetical protein
MKALKLIIFLFLSAFLSDAHADHQLVFEVNPLDNRILQLSSIESHQNIQGVDGVIRGANPEVTFRLHDQDQYLSLAQQRRSQGLAYRAINLKGWDIAKCIQARTDAIRWRSNSRRKSILQTVFEESKGPGAILDLNGYHRVFNFEGCEIAPFDEHAALLIILNRTAYDVSDFGNFMWGACMSALRIPYLFAKLGSEGNAFFLSKEQNGWANSRWFWKNWEWTGDSTADQRAILEGYRFGSSHKNHLRSRSR